MKKFFRSVTAFLYVTTQVAALLWVSLSYGIAVYATVKLEQPFPVEELSKQAIETILGISLLKTLENIFEHNNSWLLGTTRRKRRSDNENRVEAQTDEP